MGVPTASYSQNIYIYNYIYIIVLKSRFEFLLWGREPILYQSIKIPNLSHYKMMVLNPQRITENDNMILLQNEDWFLSWGYLKGKFHHYKMTIGFYHQVTWRGNYDWVFTFCLPMGKFPLLQNDFRFLKVFQLPKRWKRIKCNSQALGTKCLAHPHFFILI